MIEALATKAAEAAFVIDSIPRWLTTRLIFGDSRLKEILLATARLQSSL